MNHHHNFPNRLGHFAVFVCLLTLHVFGGCNNPGDALPSSTNVTVHRDAATKRDVSSATGGAIVAGTGGTGGTTDMIGLGGTTTTTMVPDAATPPRDGLPDLAADAPRTVQDVASDASSTVTVDLAAEFQRETFVQDMSQPDAPSEGQRETSVQDVSQPDAPSEGPRDTTVGSQDSAPDSPSDAAPDLPNGLGSDGPGDSLPDLLVTPEVGDTPPADVPPDGPPISTCSNPSWANLFNTPAQGWTSGDKEGNIFVANTLSDPLVLGTVGTLTTTGDTDAVIVRLDPATGNPVWGKQFGDAAAQTALGVAVDKSGRVGFVGSYQGGMTVGASSISNLGAWPYGYVGALQATDGTGLWAISANLNADLGSSAYLSNIAANPNFDDFVVCGSANIAALELVASPTYGGGYDIVVAKVKGSDGTIVWSRQIGGTGNQTCTAATIDDSGNILIAGNYNGVLDFGSGAFNPSPAANIYLPWVAKLSGSDGSTLAATNALPAPTNSTRGKVYSLDTDSAGNVAIAGYFTNAITFGTTTLTSAGAEDAFAAKFSPALTLTWAKNWGDAKSQHAYSAAFDSSGNLTLVGDFLSTINIGSSGAILTASSDAVLGSASDIFVARLEGSTGNSQCALSFGDPLSQSAYNAFVPRLATGATKDALFVSGGLTVNSVLNFGATTLTAPAIPNTSFWLARF
jgi:hypothetical protein